MNKELKKHLFDFFSGKVTEIDLAIHKTFEQSSEMMRNIVSHHFSGGSYKSAQCNFFVSEPTYYRYIRKFIESLEKLIKFGCIM